VLRPVGPTACSLLGAVLRPRDTGQRDAAADAIAAWWRDILDAVDADAWRLRNVQLTRLTDVAAIAAPRRPQGLGPGHPIPQARPNRFGPW
jgi:hypothetical protein